MMNNCELISSRVQVQRETSRGTKRPHLSPSSSSQAGRSDSLSSSEVESEGRSPRRMRMSPTHAFGGGIADPNMQVTEIQNTPVPPRPLVDVYGPPLPQLQPRPPAPRPLDAYRYPAPSASQSCLPRTQPLPSPLPLPSQRQCRQQQQQRTRHQASPPLVHRHGKRTVYVQDAVFKLLVMSQLDTSN